MSDQPYVLHIELAAGELVTIDLDEPGWSTTYSAFMRGAGVWSLLPIDQRWPTLRLIVKADEQPYYTARHVGATGSGGSNEIIAYGLGIRHGGSVWALPGGVVCQGDDVYDIGIAAVYGLGPREVP